MPRSGSNARSPAAPNLPQYRVPSSATTQASPGSRARPGDAAHRERGHDRHRVQPVTRRLHPRRARHNPERHATSASITRSDHNIWWSDHSPHFTSGRRPPWHPSVPITVPRRSRSTSPAPTGASTQTRTRATPGRLILNASGKLIANYWLDEVYPRRGRRPPRGRPPPPRPRRPGRLLRRLVAADGARTGLQRRAGPRVERTSAALLERARPARQLPRHAAERVGGRAGVQLVRHLPRPYVRIDA
jgi:hypothetical protein